MEKLQNGTLITGLWIRYTKKDHIPYFIGRIGHNLNAVVIANKSKREDPTKDTYPDYYLFFVNGSQDKIDEKIHDAMKKDW